MFIGQRFEKEGFSYETDGRPQGAHRTWFRGEHCNYNPNAANMRAFDAVDKHILHGWMPDRPFINLDTRITAFGSCFAENIAGYLNKKKYSILSKWDNHAYVVSMGEGIVNTFAIRQQFEWAFKNKRFEAELWHGYDGKAFGYDEDVRRATLEVFNQTDVFIITLGLSEVWYDEATGEAFWRAVPERIYDPSRHRFKVSSFNENLDNLTAIYELIREHRPEARVILTLSPIPLVATFRPQSCITANAVSKAILRAAVDELHRRFGDEGHLFYWPSYEIVMEAFLNCRERDRRHVKPPVLTYIMTLFEKYFCEGGAAEAAVVGAFVKARAANGDYSWKLVEAVERGEGAAIRTFAEQRLGAGDHEGVEPILRYFQQLHADNKDLVAAWALYRAKKEEAQRQDRAA